MRPSAEKGKGTPWRGDGPIALWARSQLSRLHEEGAKGAQSSANAPALPPASTAVRRVTEEYPYRAWHTTRSRARYRGHAHDGGKGHTGTVMLQYGLRLVHRGAGKAKHRPLRFRRQTFASRLPPSRPPLSTSLSASSSKAVTRTCRCLIQCAPGGTLAKPNPTTRAHAPTHARAHDDDNFGPCARCCCCCFAGLLRLMSTHARHRRRGHGMRRCVQHARSVADNEPRHRAHKLERANGAERVRADQYVPTHRWNWMRPNERDAL